jgi:hypothetical protein
MEWWMFFDDQGNDAASSERLSESDRCSSLAALTG